MLVEENLLQQIAIGMLRKLGGRDDRERRTSNCITSRTLKVS